MFRLAVQEELVLANPVLGVRKPKLHIRRPNHTPNESELRSIFSHLFPGARRFFLAFLNSGCRKAELVNCRVRDADLDGRLLRVVGKGRKERLVPINAILKRCIVEELAGRPGASADEPLFLNKYGRGYRSMREALTTACRKAGVPRITHHSLRHAYATLARGKGMKIEDLSKILGHANPTVTQNIYVTVFDPALRNAAENFSISPERKSVKKVSTDEKKPLQASRSKRAKAANH
ncbi:MAG TPA: tyrosine-type recombinase/integrase [Acidobacteriota bacterium]|nr:tyrosine-type recombinase/integrase [Acidobacteriota bacterium]